MPGGKKVSFPTALLILRLIPSLCSRGPLGGEDISSRDFLKVVTVFLLGTCYYA